MYRDYTLFGNLLSQIKDGMQITFTKKNVAEGDDFLIFNNDDESTTITLHTKCVPFWIEFDNAEPMRLEDTPVSFWKSILKNIEK